MQESSLWTTLRLAADQPDRGVYSLWDRLRERIDLALHKPQAAPGVVASRLTGREGPYYVLKNPETTTYYRLGERDYFLWERMDGDRTVKDLVVAYFLEFGSFAFGRVARLVSELKANSFLTDKPVYVYRQTRKELQRRSPGYRLQEVAGAFMQKEFAIGGLDGVLGGVYRRGGWLLFTRPVQIVYILLSVVGIYFFLRTFTSGGYSLVATAGGSITLGLVSLVAIQFLSIMIHELAHALAVKHYGREVRRAGAMIYYGLPGFFVDTTDIWLEDKRARLAVTWAGPYSGLVLAGLASVALVVWPGFALNQVLFKFAFLSYFLVFMNLNPLLKLDGYYLLMDWLEIPMLRTKSLEFLRAGLPGKLQQMGRPAQGRPGPIAWLQGLRSFSREEWIFTVFGLLSAVWSAYAVYLGFTFWQTRLAGAVRNLFAAGGSFGSHLLGGLVVLASVAFLAIIAIYPLRLLQGALRGAARRGTLANTWRVAAFLLLLVAILALALALLASPAFSIAAGIVALCLVLYLAYRDAVNFAGSRFAPVLWLLALTAAAFLLDEIATGVARWDVLGAPFPQLAGTGLALLASVCLLLASGLLLAGIGLRRIRPWEGAVMGLGLAAALGLAVLVAQRLGIPTSLEGLLYLGRILLPWLALVLLVPTLGSYWRTSFGPAWVCLALALGWLVVAPFVELATLPAYLLLACCLGLHYLAFSQVALRLEAPRATLDLSDRNRLKRAFAWTFDSVSSQFREVAGERQAGILAERFNDYALAARWPVRLDGGRVDDAVPEELSLIERGEAYAASLTLLLDLCGREVGDRLAVGALQGAYDALPWEEREIAGQYLFPHVDQARALSREFQATHQEYAGLLRRMPLFATMSEAELELMVSRLKLERHGVGRTIIRQGDEGHRFYIVRRGHVEVTQRDERGVTGVVNQLDRGDYFGELALLRDAPRNATCRATVPTETLSLSREDFGRLVRERFALRDKVDRSIARAELLRRLPLFAELDGLQIQRVAAQLREEDLETGAVFIRQGEIGDSFYLIESGRVQVYVTDNGHERAVFERGPGEYVGEIALLLDVPRTASVRALAETRLLVLHKDDFNRLVSEHLYVSRGLERETSRRMIDLRRAGQEA